MRRGRIKALMVLLVCAAPVVASYLMYYVIPPSGRTNYGDLLVQQPVGELKGVDLQNVPTSMAAFEGRWLMVLASADGCGNEACRQRLYLSRQVRTTAGKDMDRVGRVLLLTGDAVPSAELLQQHPGLSVIRVPAASFDALFGLARLAGGGSGAAGAAVANHPASPPIDALYMVDPLGHLMLRYPSDFDANRFKKDLSKLLRASRVG